MWLLCLLVYLLIGVFVASVVRGFDPAMFCESDSVWITLFWPLFIVIGLVILPFMGAHKLGVFIGRRINK